MCFQGIVLVCGLNMLALQAQAESSVLRAPQPDVSDVGEVDVIAEPARKVIVLGVNPNYPNAYLKHDMWVGFEVEIWHDICNYHGWDTRIVQVSDPHDYFSDLRAAGDDKPDQVRVLGGGLSVTNERIDQGFSPSQDTLKSGLAIGVKWDAGREAGSRLVSMLHMLFQNWASAGIFAGICCFAFVALFFAHSERPRHWLFSSVFGTLAISLVGLQIASALDHWHRSAESIAGIDGVQDLRGMKVAVKENTTAHERLADELGVELVVFRPNDLESAVDVYERMKAALVDESVDALVADWDMLMFFQATVWKEEIMVVGDRFDEQDHAFYVRSADSALLADIDRAIIALRRQDAFKQRRDNYNLSEVR